MKIKELVPPAGEKKVVQITGKSLIIQLSSVYAPDQLPPYVRFKDGSEFDVFPRNTYAQVGNKEFNSFELYGTEDSAGDEITFLSVDFCLPIVYNQNFDETYSAPLGVTFSKIATNDVQSLSELELVNDSGSLPSAIYINCAPLTASENGIKYAFGVNPVQGLESLGYQLKDDSAGEKKIIGIANILAFRFIAQTLGENPVLNITCEY